MSCFLYVDDEEAGAKINIDELFERKQSRNLKQLSIFNKILARVQRRIQLTARNKRTDQHIWFQVPEYIFGEAIYDKGDCIAYVVNKLESNGFYVRYLHPNTIFVSWANYIPNYVRTEFKKKTGKIMNEKGVIIDPKENSSESTDDNLHLTVEERMNMGLMNGGKPNSNATSHETTTGSNDKDKPSSKYISTSKYKPSGKFIYNPDLLDTLGDRLA